ncbi:MAG TPA: hypothetical protein VF698_00805 [Thermoanaerobaculia bacterium]|jgi:hypothetical protein
MQMRTFVLLLALSCAGAVSGGELVTTPAPSSLTVLGGITVLPALPIAANNVTIRLANTFGAQAAAGSSSIVRTGNTFAIQQSVSIVCTSPSNPIVTSDFNVGQLPPGIYNVIAKITFIDPSPVQPCIPPPIVQTATFVVAPSIPLFDGTTLAILGAALATIAMLVLRGRA